MPRAVSLLNFILARYKFIANHSPNAVRTVIQKSKSGFPLAEIWTSEGAMLIRMSLTKVEGEENGTL